MLQLESTIGRKKICNVPFWHRQEPFALRGPPQSRPTATAPQVEQRPTQRRSAGKNLVAASGYLSSQRRPELVQHRMGVLPLAVEYDIKADPPAGIAHNNQLAAVHIIAH